MTPTYDKIHLRFRLNGLHFTREELKEVAYSFVKEGEAYERSVGDFLIDWLNDWDFVHVKTSGSTGTPKLIKLKKQHMVNSAIATGDFFDIHVGDRALHCLPSKFIAGKMMLVRAMILGLEIDLVEPSSQPLALVSGNYDFCAMVPLQAERSLTDLNRIKTLIIGGAPVSDALVQQLQKKQTKAFETYGMTETITHIAARPLNHSSKEETTAFRLLPNVRIRQDERDCLVIDAPDVTAELVVTNDLVSIEGETQFKWLGRHDNVINSGGMKLIPEQIEEKLSSVIDQRFYVMGIDDSGLGEKMVLMIEGNGDKEAIFDRIKSLGILERFEMPKEIFFIESFKETPTGKVIRQL